MFIVDSHCHLDALDYETLHQNIADVVAKAKASDVKHLLAIGVTLSRFEKVYPELAKFDNVSLACGVHPLDFEEEPQVHHQTSALPLPHHNHRRLG